MKDEDCTCMDCVECGETPQDCVCNDEMITSISPFPTELADWAIRKNLRETELLLQLGENLQKRIEKENIDGETFHKEELVKNDN